MQKKLQKNGCTLTIDSVGAEIVSFQMPDGTERIWTADPAVWAAHSPVLFPIVGALGKDGVRIGDKMYQMGRHGFARKCEFKLSDCGEDYAVYCLMDDEETRAQYPFHFALYLIHRLTDNGFSTTYRVENRGEADMPFCIGGHTGFLCPAYPGEKFSDYRLVFEEKETCEAVYLDTDGLLHPEKHKPFLVNSDTYPLNYRDFDEDALVLLNMKSRQVHLTNGRHGVRFAYPSFPHLGLWTATKKDAPYLCIEPWQGYAAVVGESGVFTDKPGCVTLKMGEIYQAGYTAELY